MKILNLFIILTIVLALSLVSCQQKEEVQTKADAEKPSKILNLSEVTTIMTVKEINLAERLFTLEYADGNMIAVEAAEDLVGIDKIMIGDKLSVTYLTSTAVYVTSSDEERPPVVSSQTVEVGAEAGKPRKITVHIVEKTSTVEAIDVEKRLATLKDHEGNVSTIEVADDVRNLENVKVGDQVVYQVTTAIAVNIEKVE